MKNKIQVNKEHYSWKYESLGRWASYYYQIDNILKNLDSKEQKILEVGVGNHFVQDKLKRGGFKIYSVDFDRSLNPDYVADIRKLPFKNNSFDVVCAFEVLEHLPFTEFKKTLLELKRVSKGKILFSVPYICFHPYVEFKLLPLIRPKIFEFRIPLFFLKHRFDGEHYWEIGKKGFPFKKIKKEIKKSNLKINYVWKVPKINQVGFCLEK